MITELSELRALVFTTFTFDPGFFVDNVLPVALDLVEADADLRRAKDRRATRARVGDSLASLPVTVFHDAFDQRQHGEPWRYVRVPVAVPGRFFHSKLVLAAGTLPGGEPAVLAMVSSANLTLSGWGRNAECRARIAILSQQQQAYGALRFFLEWLRRKTSLHGRGDQHEATERVLSTLDDLSEEPPSRVQRKEFGDWLEGRLYFSRNQDAQGLPAFMRAGRRGRPSKLISYSPYWGEVEANCRAFNAVHTTLAPALLAGGETVGLAEAPAGVTLMRNPVDHLRFWHAKLHWLQWRSRASFAVGSCNFTRNGLCGPQGNVEAAVVYDLSISSASGLPKLRAFGDRQIAEAESSEEGAPESVPVEVSVVFDWKARRFEWRWTPTKGMSDGRLELPGVAKIRLTKHTGRRRAAKPCRSFTLHWRARGEPRSWKGLVVEVGLDHSEQDYGRRLRPLDIMDSWKGKRLPVGTGGGGGGGGPGVGSEEEPQGPADFHALNLYEVYRSFWDLRARLGEWQDDLDARRAMLLTRPDSVIALARMASDGDRYVANRYLVLRECEQVFECFGRDLDRSHLRNLQTLGRRLRAHLVAALAEDVRARHLNDDPEALLSWFEREIERSWRPG
jgi:hypothetical protein